MPEYKTRQPQGDFPKLVIVPAIEIDEFSFHHCGGVSGTSTDEVRFRQLIGGAMSILHKGIGRHAAMAFTDLEKGFVIGLLAIKEHNDQS